jgi:hypothetical protein
MNPVKLLLALHAQRPVGTPASELQRAHDLAYRPFLESLERHGFLRVALHLSGGVLDHLAAQQPETLSLIRTLIGRGQLEMLGGALAPVPLGLLPERDALVQLEAMKARLAELFDVLPRGAWIDRAAFEPELPRLLKATGHGFTFVSGEGVREALPPGAGFGYFAAERAGASLAVFPLSLALSSAIPFGAPQDLALLLEEAAHRPAPPGGLGLTFGGPLEAFGLWPRSHSWCYARGKLDALLERLQQASAFLELLPPSEYLARFPPSGTLHLRPERPLLGHDAGVDALHRRMLRTSARLFDAVAELGEESERLAEARTELVRGQALPDADALLLPALRTALHGCLIRADNLIDAETRGDGDFIEYEEDDLDADLRDEALLANGQIAALVDPDAGGAVCRLDFRPPAVALGPLPARRSRPLHPASSDPDPAAPPRGPFLEAAAEPGLEALAIDDGTPRFCFVDRFHAPDFSLEALVRGSDGDIGDFAQGQYVVEASGVDEEGDLSASVTLVRDGKLAGPEGVRGLLVEKTFHVPIDAGRLEAEYILENSSDAPLSFIFVPELNLGVLGAPGPERYLQIGDGERTSLTERTVHAAVDHVQLIDEAEGVAVELSLDRAVELWSYPVEAVVPGETGDRRVLQGVCLLPRMPLTLPPRESVRLVIKLEVARVEFEAEDALDA